MRLGTSGRRRYSGVVMNRSTTFSLGLALAAAAGFSIAWAAPVNEPVYRSGNWYVVRTTQPDGAIACTGFYRAHREVQLTQDTLIVKLQGKVDQVMVGYDGQAATARPL